MNRVRQPKRAAASKCPALERAREFYGRRAWGSAYEAFLRAEQEIALAAEDIERLAMAGYLTGRDDDYLIALERAYHAHCDAGQPLRAVRCAFWLGFRALMRGETGRASGWLARGQRLLDRNARECAERGYLLLPVVEQRLDAGDHEGAYLAAAEAAAIGERCRDADLIACARHQQGRIRLQQGQIEAGLALLDETMLAVTAGELSTLVAGLMFCSVIAACQEVYALDRSREWIAAMTHWCEGQPDMVAFAGVCQVHRAEIMQLRGAWPDAIDAARRACVRSQGVDRRATAAAYYQQAEVLRLKGAFAAAEEAYRNASQAGLDPQPGFALLRHGQGRTDAAAAAIRSSLGTTTSRLRRMSLLPAYVEIMVAAGEIEAAREASRDLEDLARGFDTAVPDAMAAQARGVVELAEGNAQAAIVLLRRAFDVWQRIEAPYAAARVRVLIGEASRALGDEDGASLEFGAAKSIFGRLGAVPDLARIGALTQGNPSAAAHPLTPRELQVLRLVAAGKTNATIADELSLSERTIERHLSNIFTRLDLSSRTAATAWAYDHDLI
jgi:DNA-binding CsgD family transcriptional regulator